MRLPCALMLTGCLLLSGVIRASAQSPATYQLTAFPQRMSDRYTTKHGLPGKSVSDLFFHEGALYAVTDLGQAAFTDGKWKQVETNRQVKWDRVTAGTPKLDEKGKQTLQKYKATSALAAPNGDVWFMGERDRIKGVYRITSKGEVVPFSKPTSYLTQQVQVNIDAVVSCIAMDSLGHLWFGTNAGAYATDGKNWWNPIDRRNGLPYDNVTSLAFGKEGEIWIGTTEGVCRYTSTGTWQYYWGPRWLPGNRVNAIEVAQDGSAWIATDNGVARLYDKRITLAEKAAHYEEITAKRHNRYGFVTDGGLKVPGDPDSGAIYEASDNDGLWTSMYVAAESFRYATTKEPEARALAKKSMWAMLDMLKYSGVPGFPVRTFFRKGEKDVTGYNPDETVRIDGETDKIWYTSPVDPNILCKGDTSSDELDGHYFAWYVYHDLVADAAEKKEIAKAIRACTDNILSHDLTLVGPTGRKTRWGVWNPKFVNDDPMWWEERGLNSMEILCYLKATYHITGDEKYMKVYKDLIEKHHYLLNTVNQKRAEPWYLVNHSDDEMAFLNYYELMLLEKEPDTRRILMQSIDRSWKIERPEASPFFNFVYGAVTGRACDVEAAVETLQDWPWELISWQIKNSHRSDVTLLTTFFEGRTRMQSVKLLPASERRAMKWNGNPFDLDDGDPAGRGEEDGAAWLMPYWMGRYHGIIK